MNELIAFIDLYGGGGGKEKKMSLIGNGITWLKVNMFPRSQRHCIGGSLGIPDFNRETSQDIAAFFVANFYRMVNPCDENTS